MMSELRGTYYPLRNGTVIKPGGQCNMPFLERPDDAARKLAMVSDDLSLVAKVHELASNLYLAKEILEIRKSNKELWMVLNAIIKMLRRYKRITINIKEEDVYKLPDDKAEAISGKLLQLIVEIYNKLIRVGTWYEIDIIFDMLAEGFTSILREAGL